MAAMLALCSVAQASAKPSGLDNRDRAPAQKQNSHRGRTRQSSARRGAAGSGGLPRRQRPKSQPLVTAAMAQSSCSAPPRCEDGEVRGALAQPASRALRSAHLLASRPRVDAADNAQYCGVVSLILVSDKYCRLALNTERNKLGHAAGPLIPLCPKRALFLAARHGGPGTGGPSLSSSSARRRLNQLLRHVGLRNKRKRGPASTPEAAVRGWPHGMASSTALHFCFWGGRAVQPSAQNRQFLQFR